MDILFVLLIEKVLCGFYCFWFSFENKREESETTFHSIKISEILLKKGEGEAEVPIKVKCVLPIFYEDETIKKYSINYVRN